MKKIMKRHSSFLAWVFLPSLLLVTAVLGVNIVSRPSAALLGSTCDTLAGILCAPPTNSCIPEFCSTTPLSAIGVCEPPNPASPYVGVGQLGTTCGCYICGNGRCEGAIGEDSLGSPDFCRGDCNGSIPIVNGKGVNYIPSICSTQTPCNPIVDGCCPNATCGTTPGSANFDPDCCSQCGDGIVSPPETCEPGIPGCSQGETCVNCQCVTIPTACPTNPAIPLAEIECIPDALTQGCDNNCHCEFTIEGGGPFVSGCGGRTDAGPLNALCLTRLTGAAGTQTIVPPSIFQTMNPAVLGGIAAMIGIPGGVFAATRWRKKRK